MKILFIINPNCGTGKIEEVTLRIEEMAIAKNAEIRLLYTTGNNDDESIKKSIKEFNPDRVVAGGGDGSVQLVARNLMKTKIPLAVLPIGSANGLATSLDLPLKLPECVDYLFGELQTKPFDLLEVNKKYCCVHLADIGINARIVKEYALGEDSGMLGYAKHLVKAIRETPLMHYNIRTEDQEMKKEGYLLAFANTNRYGTGIHITEGSAHDGLFEIRNIPKVSLEDAIKAGLTLFNIFVDPNMTSEVISCRNADIRTDEKVDLQIDGEYIGEVDHITVQVIPAAITILLP